MTKKISKLLNICILFILNLWFSSNANAACNWKSRNATFTTADSCKLNIGQAKFVGYISFNSNQSCLKYTWRVNNTVIGTSSSFNYITTTNGTYNICVTVRDTCNNCDTTYCATKVISCFKNCIFGWSNIGYLITDSCNGYGPSKYSIGGQVGANNKCNKFEWRVNGVKINSSSNNNLYYAVSKNGTYSVCLKIIDTCRNCDTTICSTKTFNCVPNSNCNWKSKNASLYAWDSCKSNNSSINAELSFNGSPTTCYKYTWKLNNTIISNSTSSRLFKYYITQNGTYNICVTVYDTCKKCDTTYCTTKNISCFNTCIFGTGKFFYGIHDSCNKANNKRYTIGGLISNKSTCNVFEWRVNGVKQNNVNGNNLYYKVTKNGTYQVCLKVIDTCTKCDTTICETKTFTCLTSPCNWKARSPYMYAWDTCKGPGNRNSVNAYISFNYSNQSCFKYSWTVNGNIINGALSNVFHYPITKNGQYNICVKVIDTCNNCDTVFCLTKNITCFPSCNWKNRSPYMYSWDTCKGSGNRNSVNAYISFNYNNTKCFTYTWSVNGTVISGLKSNVFNYPINKNGSYTICVKVTDTCNKCDTVLCSTKTITCFNACNWKKRLYTINVTDTCRNNKNENSSSGYIMLNPNMNNTCVRYTWKIDNVVVSNNYYFRTFITRNGTHSYCVYMIDTCTKCDTTICFTRTFNCRSLGINTSINDDLIVVNPVPAQQFVFIQSEIESNSSVVYDINGKTVWIGSIVSGENTINISDWPQGIYILTIMHKEGILTKKILKE